MKQASADRCQFPDWMVQLVYRDQDGLCPCCCRPLEDLDWQEHHRSGNNADCSIENLVCACYDCHLYCYHQGAWKNPPVEPLCCSVCE